MLATNYASLLTCGEARGAVVAIDVIRAFTTAAFALAAGAEDITLVSTVEEAFALRGQIPGALIMGEVGGLPVEGFDFGNSPGAFVGLDLGGRHLIQRTSAGTQGVVNSQRADLLLTSSFVVAEATVRYLQRHLAGGQEPSVTFVITGARPAERLAPAGQPQHGLDIGDEDLACADYLAARLRGERPDPQPYLERVWQSRPNQQFGDLNEYEALVRQDMQACTELDRFDFAMLVERLNGRLVMRAVKE